MIRVAIIDDEAPARRKMKRLLAAVPDWQLVGEADDVDSAIALINTASPDVVLLDIQLKNATGFDVLSGLTSHHPRVVFVTAYDHYALQAFDVHAQDYLLKPVMQNRFAAMAKRLTESCSGTAEQPGIASSMVQQLESMIQHLKSTQARPSRMLLERNERSVFVDHDRILTIRSDGNYLIIQLADCEYRQRGTLTRMLSRLSPEHFAQISRSCIVNLNAIREVQAWFKGTRLIILSTGEELKVSANYWKLMATRLG